MNDIDQDAVVDLMYQFRAGAKLDGKYITEVENPVEYCEKIIKSWKTGVTNVQTQSRVRNTCCNRSECVRYQ